jgi:hypothetical protein
MSRLIIWINVINRLDYMCLRRAPEKYITGAALDRAVLDPYVASQLPQKTIFKRTEASVTTQTPKYLRLSLSVINQFIFTITQVVSPRVPTAVVHVPCQVMLDFWFTKWHWGEFSPGSSVSSYNFNSINSFKLINFPVIPLYVVYILTGSIND